MNAVVQFGQRCTAAGEVPAYACDCRGEPIEQIRCTLVALVGRVRRITDSRKGPGKTGRRSSQRRGTGVTVKARPAIAARPIVKFVVSLIFIGGFYKKDRSHHTIKSRIAQYT